MRALVSGLKWRVRPCKGEKMIDWHNVENGNPMEDGQYLIYCFAPNFESDWIDIARFDKGHWHALQGLCSHVSRIRFWAEINRPTLA